jgi:hypothetical protein
MSALEILATARAVGVRLSLDGDKVIAESPDKVPAELVEAIRAAKPDLLRVLRQRESPPEDSLADAVAAYFTAYREWRGPPGVLFAKVGRPLDEDEHVMVDMLSMAEDPLAKRGVALRLERGYAVLTRAQLDLVGGIVAYMAERVSVSATPDRLLAVLDQPPLADEAAAIDRFKEIADTLFAHGIEIRLEHGHVILEHAWKGCRPNNTLSSGTAKKKGDTMTDTMTVERPSGATKQQWVDACAGRERFIAQGWASKASQLGWSESELFAVPSDWPRIAETGASLLIGRWEIAGVDQGAITIKPPWSSSQLKIRKLRNRHAQRRETKEES